jgi:hypothetical protein
MPEVMICAILGNAGGVICGIIGGAKITRGYHRERQARLYVVIVSLKLPRQRTWLEAF